MAFKDLREYSQGTHLDLPIDGVTYRIQDVDAHTGLLVQQLMDAGLEAHQGGEVDLDQELLDDVSERDLFRDVLGDAFDQMLNDGVGWSDVKRAATTAMVWICFDENAAEKYWMTGGDAGEAQGPAPAPNRAARRASAAVDRTTRKRVSGSTTKASGSRSAPRKPATGSRGKPSGSSGA